MTYLELVNGVLTRLREPEAPSIIQSTDHVVNMAKALVNDAKRYVEACHSWNATRKVWLVETEEEVPSYILEDTAGGCRISKVAIEGQHIHQWDLQSLLHSTKPAKPYQFAFDGTDGEGNISLRLGPVPDASYEVQVLGHRVLADLKTDDDPLRLPAQPVLYYALALAARERGEVGGQTAAEIFTMSQQYISDAIALDSNLSPTEKTWVVV